MSDVKTRTSNNNGIFDIGNLSTLLTLISVILMSILVGKIPLNPRTIVTNELPEYYEEYYSNIFYRVGYFGGTTPDFPQRVIEFTPLFLFYLFLVISIFCLIFSVFFIGKIHNDKERKIYVIIRLILCCVPVIIGIVKLVKLVNIGHNFGKIWYSYDWETDLHPTEIVLPIAFFPFIFTLFTNINSLRGTEKHSLKRTIPPLYSIVLFMLTMSLLLNYLIYIITDMFLLGHVNFFYIFLIIVIFLLISWIIFEKRVKRYKERDMIEKNSN